MQFQASQTDRVTSGMILCVGGLSNLPLQEAIGIPQIIPSTILDVRETELVSLLGALFAARKELKLR